MIAGDTAEILLREVRMGQDDQEENLPSQGKQAQSYEASPATEVALTDPGDDTARRFRYQWTHAASICCGLLDDTLDIDEVYCEQHEDILIRHKDGRFTGVQVKTKDSNQPVWKSGDDSLVMSVSRFCQLDARFVGNFRAFRFVTQHPLHSAESGTCFTYILKLAKEHEAGSTLASKLSPFVKKIAKLSKCSDEAVVEVLRKTFADDSLPKLKDVETRLLQDLEQVWTQGQTTTIDQLKRTAEDLIAHCMRASSLGFSDSRPMYFSSLDSFGDEEMKRIIEGKRIDKSILSELLAHWVSGSAPLSGPSTGKIKIGDGDKSLLVKKLEAGGLSAGTISLAAELRDKADYLGISWTQKYGHDKGLQRYDHVKTLAHSSANKVFEDSRSDSGPFGPKMLVALKNELLGRRTDSSEIYDCTPEHLEGFVYSLTSQCKVQWSLDRPWESQND